MDFDRLQESLEAVSRGYAQAFDIDRTDDWYMLKLQEEVGELTRAFVSLKGMGRSRGLTEAEQRDAFAGECADVLAHILLLARHEGVDVDGALREKWLQRLETR